MILVTGGAGFIGSNFIATWLAERDEPVVNLDALTYAGRPINLRDCTQHPAYRFIKVDLRNADLKTLLRTLKPRAVIHFAAESHVDRSIASPEVFVETNVLGTCRLLEAALAYRESLSGNTAEDFRFINISTDEVYGSLPVDARPATEAAPFCPMNPYSASKAAADQFGRAYANTYGLPVITLRCTNNFGPRQYPEKLIPFMIRRAQTGRTLPLYGDGRQTREWIYVEDFCSAIRAALDGARPGAVYNVGSGVELSNLAVVQKIAAALSPRLGRDVAADIVFVADRPGHDRRYALDAGAITRDLGWRPTRDVEQALAHTIDWYVSTPGALEL